MSPRLSTGNSEAEETDDISTENFPSTIHHVEDHVEADAIVAINDENESDLFSLGDLPSPSTWLAQESLAINVVNKPVEFNIGSGSTLQPIEDVSAPSQEETPQTFYLSETVVDLLERNRRDETLQFLLGRSQEREREVEAMVISNTVLHPIAQSEASTVHHSSAHVDHLTVNEKVQQYEAIIAKLVYDNRFMMEKLEEKTTRRTSVASMQIETDLINLDSEDDELPAFAAPVNGRSCRDDQSTKCTSEKTEKYMTPPDGSESRSEKIKA